MIHTYKLKLPTISPDNALPEEIHHIYGTHCFTIVAFLDFIFPEVSPSYYQ